MKNCASFILALVAALLLCSCGTGRHAATPPADMSAEEAILLEMQQAQQSKMQLRQLVLDEANTWLGTPYLYGGTSRRGVDCSALVRAAYGAAGVDMPRTSAEQRAAARTIKKKKLRPADLVFFHSGKKKSGVSHVGIYIGSGFMIHASASRGVMISSLDEPYFRSHLHSCGTLLP